MRTTRAGRHTVPLRRALYAGVLGLSLACSARAATVAGVDIEETLEVAGQTLVLQGAGLRTRFFIKLYAAGLYVPSGTNTQAAWLIDSDEPIAITLDIVSDLVTRDKMVEALYDGFSASTGGNIAGIGRELQMLEIAMGDAMESGSSISFEYEPGIGTHVIRDGTETAVIEGLPFKQALFGIWLSDNPVARKLKTALLGG